MIVDCPNCKALVSATELHDHVIHDDVAPSVRVTFAHCPKCQAPFLGQGFEKEFGYEEPEQIYPALESSIPAGAPPGIRSAFAEAHKCFRAGAFTATAIMCRKAMEGICEEHGFRERNLALSLKAMKESGAIESRLYEWADALRISGNEAAHGVDLTINGEDAADILDFTTALTEYLFTFRDRFEQFKARREERRGRGLP